MDLRSWKDKAHTCTRGPVSHAQACVPGMYAWVYHSQTKKAYVCAARSEELWHPSGHVHT